MKATTAQLVARFQAGERRSGDFLARRFKAFVRQRAEIIAGDRDGDRAFVADLVQVGLIAAIGSARKYRRGPQTPEQFARLVVDGAMLNYRKRWTRPIPSLNVPKPDGAAAFLAGVRSQVEIAARVERAFECITRTEYLVVRERFMVDEPLTRADLGAALRLTARQVENIERRAMWRLGSLLKA